ncbi:MAG: hypothetical protein HW383_566 [Candidatus Magasanikbacteria bacterium]|nr:hypothetical protein [Candidatus Magasanikbacteria bacterium]
MRKSRAESFRPMSLKDDIEKQFMVSFKARDDAKIGTLRLLKSAVKNAEIEARRLLTDEEVVAVVRRQVKQLTDALADYEKGGRADFVGKTKVEQAVLKVFLPPSMDPAALEKIVRDTAAETGATSMKDAGKVIGMVMKKVSGAADGNTVKAVLAKILPTG